MPYGVKAIGGFGEPWSYHVAESVDFHFRPTHLDDEQKAKYAEAARRTNVEIWSRPADGIGAGDMVAFTSSRPPEVAVPAAARICDCVNEFAGIDRPAGMLESIRELLEDVLSGKCRPDSPRIMSMRDQLRK